MTHRERYGRVAVLSGGCSGEREISLASGRAVFETLKSADVDCEFIDFQGQDLQNLVTGFDRVFIALHGSGGEDGTVQGVLELAGMPYTGSGVLASALAMNKCMTKRLWQGLGLPTPDFLVVRDVSEIEPLPNSLEFPLMVKPNSEGSSLGMALVHSESELHAAVVEALKFDRQVLVEQYVAGVELTCGILHGEALPLIQIDTPRAYYDYVAKYQSNDTEYTRPTCVDEAAEAVIQKLCVDAFENTGCSGWGRVDLILDSEQKPWLIEMNTVPGLTDHSLVPKAAVFAGMDFVQLVLNILESSFEKDVSVPLFTRLEELN